MWIDIGQKVKANTFPRIAYSQHSYVTDLSTSVRQFDLYIVYWPIYRCEERDAYPIPMNICDTSEEWTRHVEQIHWASLCSQLSGRHKLNNTDTCYSSIQGYVSSAHLFSFCFICIYILYAAFTVCTTHPPLRTSAWALSIWTIFVQHREYTSETNKCLFPSHALVHGIW